MCQRVLGPDSDAVATFVQVPSQWCASAFVMRKLRLSMAGRCGAATRMAVEIFLDPTFS